MTDVCRRLSWLCAALLAGCDVTGAEPRAGDPAVVNAAISTEAPPPTDGEWPAFRGPHRNGISSEKDWSTTWPADGPKRLWSAEVGLGYSAVSVAAGRAYTIGNRNGQETVYCFDAVTGRELWKHSYECGLVDNLHLGGPGSSPTIDGEQVYTLSKEGHFHCFDAAKGAVRWLVHLSKDLNVPTPEWGFTSSPLVVNGMVVIEVAGLTAFHKGTGHVVWRAERQRTGYGSPIVIRNPQGATLLAGVTNEALNLLRAADGVTVASYPWTSDYSTTATTPVVSGRTYFISSGYGAGCALLELRDDRLEPLYRNKGLSTHMCTPVLHEGYLYAIDGNSHNARQCKLICLELATGKKVWEQRGFGCGALMMADGKLLVQGDEGFLSIVNATPRGFEEIARTKAFDGHTWTMPVLSHGRIYCRSEAGTVVCLDVSR